MIIVATLTLTLFGCSRINENPPGTSDSSTHHAIKIPDDSLSTISGESPISEPSPPTLPNESPPADIPVYLPPPEYEVFTEVTNNQEHLDAFLHHTALSAFYSNTSNLLIPSLRLIETWDAEGGDTYYLCWSAQFDYRGLADAIRLGEPYRPHYLDMNIRLIRFRIKDTADWGYNEFKYPGYQCVEILYTADGENDFAPNKLEGFPGSPERLQRIGIDDYDYIRDILPASIARDYYALLKAYLEYYGFTLPIIQSDYPYHPSVSIDYKDYGIDYRTTEMNFDRFPLDKLVAYYLGGDGAYSEGSSDELYRRFLETPDVVLRFIAQVRDNIVRGEPVKTLLCQAIASVDVYWYDSSSLFSAIITQLGETYLVRSDGTGEVFAILKNEYESAIDRYDNR